MNFGAGPDEGQQGAESDVRPAEDRVQGIRVQIQRAAEGRRAQSQVLRRPQQVAYQGLFTPATNWLSDQITMYFNVYSCAQFSIQSVNSGP